MSESQVGEYPTRKNGRTAKAFLLAGKAAWRVGETLRRRGLQLRVCKHRRTIGMLDMTFALTAARHECPRIHIQRVHSADTLLLYTCQLNYG